MAGTNDLMATAPVSHFNNRGVVHGPFKLNAPLLPQDMVEALSEVLVEDLSDRFLCQTFPHSLPT